jgi:hypothetical protein
MAGEMKPYNFYECLEMSHSAENLPIWKEIYSKAFPDMVVMINHREDGDHQRAGIDRSIIMRNSKQILIDEKVRGRNKKTGIAYDDIALEYWSDVENKKPGWVCKPLLCDFICYAIAPLGRAYLMPVIQLQTAWKKYCAEWIKRHQKIVAENETNGRKWKTVSVGVPPKILFPKIGEALRINFNEYEL